MIMINLIVAAGMNREIGANNKLLWKLSNDLKFFKEVTLGKTIVMGRKTFESLPGKLPNRKHIVLSRSEHKSDDMDIEYVNDINQLLERLKQSDEDVFIIGGAEIYNLFMPYADKIYCTLVYSTFNNADSFFPEINMDKFKIIGYSKEYKADNNNDYDHQMFEFIRR